MVMGSGQTKSGVQARSAGTPLPFRGDASDASLAALEFPAVLEAVAGWAKGPLGADSVRGRRPTTDPVLIADALRPLDELLTLWRRGERVDVPPVPVIADVLTRLGVAGSVLNGPELLRVRLTVSAARIAVAELTRVAADAPSAAIRVVPLPDRALDRRLLESIGDEGEVLDTASPALFRARREIHSARERLVKKLESILRSAEAQAVPQGAQVTIREDRYVIPVRRDARQRPEGIIHGESGSAGTLFIEPTAAIESGNALRSAIARAEQEELAVLRELTELVRPERHLVGAAHAMCVEGDDLLARVRYSHAVEASVPTVGSDAIDLRQARHPLLLARGLEVVPFDLLLEPNERTLLISGPNAGGKTVLLKTTGLAMVLAQSGIAPPVGPGTRLPVIDGIFVDIGDHQSIAADLSTFSAHVVALRDILATAGSDTLVLMDEIGSGTDPAEGGALAAATLRALTGRGVRTVVTTHLGALKSLASEVPGIVNGSLEFDAERLQPTFRFRKGIPGRSYGLAIARRLAIDSEVLAMADALVPRQERLLDELLAQVEQRARDLEQREAALEDRELEVGNREAVAALTAEAQGIRERELKRREKDADRQARETARRHLLEARATVEEALRLARGAADSAEAKEARRLIEEAAGRERAALDASRAKADHAEAEPDGLAVGARVRLPSGSTGVVHELRGDGKAVVTVGAVKLVAPAGELTPLAEAQAARRKTAVYEAPSAPFEVDLRGMRGDEAAVVATAALDAAVLAENPYLRIIHGMGTGVVRDRVRQILKSDRRVARFAFAPPNQGGTGVTIAEFAAG
ncbi:MAG: Smr/MutS family protein [Gemmatimonadales bacterium]|nr:Smr/MutS family protein [Gemmatimonadales bacterium]